MIWWVWKRPEVMAIAWIWVMRFSCLLHLSSKDFRDDKLVFILTGGVFPFLSLGSEYDFIFVWFLGCKSTKWWGVTSFTHIPTPNEYASRQLPT
uniref:Uncharacterized protein n=1 Tax=Helianthus annuus TaxID=4232 RepID=A0A251RZ33_HELAN